MQGTKIPVRYVGFKTFKRDTVCDTTTVWMHHGDVQLVDPSVAAKLLRFPDVWVDGDLPFTPKVHGEVVEPPVDLIFGKQPDPAEPEAPTEEEAEDEPPEGDDATQEQIITALQGLNKETDFTDAGRPRIEAIRAAMPGKKVTVQMVKDAWLAFSGA